MSEPLTPEVTYYWQVAAKDNHGAVSAGPILSFTTLDPSHIVTGVTLSENTTFSGEHGPYVISGNLTINEGVTLTIEPGAVIKMNANANILVNGTLLAEGQAGNEIVFTSIKDDSYGGDLNGDGELTSPAPGNWGRIQFNSTSTGSRLSNCTVLYGGYGSVGNIYVNGASPSITFATIRKSSNHGMYINSGSPSVQDSSIEDNGSATGHYGAYIAGGTPHIATTAIVTAYNSWIYIPVDVVGSVSLTDNTFVDPADAPGYVTVAGGTVSRDATWPAISVPYRITGNIEVQGADGSDALTTLIINPGVTLEFNNVLFRVGLNLPGSLVAQGTEAQPILFTSSQDTPAAGNWQGIHFQTKASSTSILEHCVVEYGGSTGNIYVNGPSLEITNSRIRHSSNYGIYVALGNPTIIGSQIVGNATHGVYVNTGTPVIQDSTITGNGTVTGHYGVYVAGGSPQITNTQIVSQFNSWIYIPADVVGSVTLTGSIFADSNNVPGYVTVAGGTVSRDATWPAISVPYRITGNVELRGTDGDDSLTTLTISPGVTLEFNNVFFRTGYNVPGALIARGTESQPITFTSSQDAPTPGSWQGLHFQTMASATSILEHCVVEYGGSTGNIYVNGPSLEITNSRIRHSSNYGIYVALGNPSILSGQITENSSYGIYNAGANVVSAKNIWWGDATGPYDPSDDTATGGWYNPTGLGNKVTDRVAYQPWATGSIDTDGDGISDEDEINVYGTDPNKADTDDDGLSDFAELFIYGTDPLKADTDGDGIKDGDEVAFWGDNWNADPDGDGIINLLDWDSDNDGYSDGVEKAQGTDPADDTSYPEIIVYEDAQDGLTLGWQISDADPPGAMVTNIFDANLQSYVIQLAGDGLLDSFRLYTEENADWNNINHKVIGWSMNFMEDYIITVIVQTSDGLRFLTYTPDDVSNLGSGTEVHHGLGAASMDGAWHNVITNLEFDLREAQPGNSIHSVLGFTVSGSGMVDDIMTLHQMPADLDTDGDAITDLEEINIYGTHPYNPDTDGDTLEDGAELTFWGAAWQADPDQDGLINLPDPDSDGDGFDDGIEITGGTDPADAASFPVE